MSERRQTSAVALRWRDVMGTGRRRMDGKGIVCSYCNSLLIFSTQTLSLVNRCPFFLWTTDSCEVSLTHIKCGFSPLTYPTCILMNA
jgi:hypothetical protein